MERRTLQENAAERRDRTAEANNFDWALSLNESRPRTSSSRRGVVGHFESFVEEVALLIKKLSHSHSGVKLQDYQTRLAEHTRAQLGELVVLRDKFARRIRMIDVRCPNDEIDKEIHSPLDRFDSGEQQAMRLIIDERLLQLLAAKVEELFGLKDAQKAKEQRRAGKEEAFAQMRREFDRIRDQRVLLEQDMKERANADAKLACEPKAPSPSSNEEDAIARRKRLKEIEELRRRLSLEKQRVMEAQASVAAAREDCGSLQENVQELRAMRESAQQSAAELESLLQRTEQDLNGASDRDIERKIREIIDREIERRAQLAAAPMQEDCDNDKEKSSLKEKIRQLQDEVDVLQAQLSAALAAAAAEARAAEARAAEAAATEAAAAEAAAASVTLLPSTSCDRATGGAASMFRSSSASLHHVSTASGVAETQAAVSAKRVNSQATLRFGSGGIHENANKELGPARLRIRLPGFFPAELSVLRSVLADASLSPGQSQAADSGSPWDGLTSEPAHVQVLEGGGLPSSRQRPKDRKAWDGTIIHGLQSCTGFG